MRFTWQKDLDVFRRRCTRKRDIQLTVRQDRFLKLNANVPQGLTLGFVDFSLPKRVERETEACSVLLRNP